MPTSEHASAVCAEIQKKLGGSANPTEIVLGFVEGVAAVLDGKLEMAGKGLSDTAGKMIPLAGPAGSVANVIVSLYKGADKAELPNPYFVGNGHGDADSPYTNQYLRNRHKKGIAGSAAGAAGAVASAWTAVDVSGIAMHGNAVGSTLAHLARFAQMMKASKAGGTVAQWLELVIKMKSVKATARTAGLVGAAVPIPVVGITTGVLASIAATGAKLTYTKACLATSLELHWRARQEQFMSGTALGLGTGGSVGPASRIVWELFTRRGMTRILGKYDIDRLVNEPAGWYAINDKLMLI